MADPIALSLLNGATATGDWFTWPGGDGMFKVDCAGYNGATVQLEVKGLGGTRGVPVDPSGSTNVTFTADHVGGFTLGPNQQIRAAITTAVPSSPVYAQAATTPRLT